MKDKFVLQENDMKHNEKITRLQRRRKTCYNFWLRCHMELAHNQLIFFCANGLYHA
jgi:hypothetical protein